MDNLRVAVETAKRFLTKEKIDRQMLGQSSTTPCMKVNDEPNYSSKHSKTGVTFDALETIGRNSDSIDKLTLLVSKMNMKMDKPDMQYKPQVYQGRRRGQNRCDNRPNNDQTRNRSYSRDKHTTYRGRGNYDRNFRSSYRGRPRDTYRWDKYRVIGMTIQGKIMEETTIGIITGKIMVELTTGNKDITV